MTEEQKSDVIMLMATMRAFNEQLYNLKGVHKQGMKMKFNRLLKVSAQYEREIVHITQNSQEFEDVYDALMDVILEVKQQINGQKESNLE